MKVLVHSSSNCPVDDINRIMEALAFRQGIQPPLKGRIEAC